MFISNAAHLQRDSAAATAGAAVDASGFLWGTNDPTAVPSALDPNNSSFLMQTGPGAPGSPPESGNEPPALRPSSGLTDRPGQIPQQAPPLGSQPGVVFKVLLSDDVIRFRLLQGVDRLALVARVTSVLDIPEHLIKLKYQDDENEWCILGSDADMQEALVLAQLRGCHPKVKLIDPSDAKGQVSQPQNL
jgi:hypothetical protein